MSHTTCLTDSCACLALRRVELEQEGLLGLIKFNSGLSGLPIQLRRSQWRFTGAGLSRCAYPTHHLT